jgi:peptidyl-dipeptidase A
VTARFHAAALLAVLVASAACGGAVDQPLCPSPQTPAPPAPAPTSSAPPADAAPTVDEAVAFVNEVDTTLRRLWAARDTANWVNETYITDDTEALAAANEEATAAYVGRAVHRARRFDPIASQLPADVARKLYLLALTQTVPAPDDPARRAELASIESWMTSAYGKAQYCPPDGSPLLRYRKADKGEKVPPCLHLDELSAVLAKSRRPEELTEAWRGWYSSAGPMRAKYPRYVELANEGARDLGFADVGAMWRSRFDMSPSDFEADIERLWNDVKPLYEALHCYVRSRLQEQYGKAMVPDHAPIPAELLGNMWAQEWNNVLDRVVPYPHEPSLDVGRKLASGHWDARRMVQQGERFFTSLGFDPLPDTFWQRSQLTRPRDRDVVCHASAWDVAWDGDLRVKMCIQPTEEDFVTIHHELGHDFYFQRYVKLPILFQAGANDGFHEAIGDTMALSVTPQYLHGLGLLDALPKGDHGRINQQMKMALDKVAFLPFGLLLDKWRWDVFAGKVAPADYESSWLALTERYQGIRPPVARTADDFDPGGKYHVASSATYVIYFLARIYQFQFHKALCVAAGYTGPLDQCSIHDDKAAGARLMAMLALGQSKPWPDAMEALGAGRSADAGPMLEYFAPLMHWLADANRGKVCGW